MLLIVHAERPRTTQNYVYVCGICGSQWARHIRAESSRDWWPVRRSCENCPSTTEDILPGSLADIWDPPVGRYAELPRAYLLRELELEPAWGMVVADSTVYEYTSSTLPTQPMELKMDQDLQIKIAGYKAQSIAGTITDDQLREALKLLREDRMNAALASKSAKTKVSGPVPSPDEVLAMFNKKH